MASSLAPGPLVSVVIPVFNRRLEVQRAIGSVLAQTYRHWEIVVVDDASPEDVASVVTGLGDPRIRLVRLERNAGAGGARNAGIAAALGEWVAFLDSDDEWVSSKLADQIAFLRDRPRGMRAACGGYEIRHAHDKAPRVFRPTPALTTLDALGWGCHLSPGSTLIVERACFAQIGPFDPTLRRFEDWDWLLRYAQHHALGADPRICAVIHKDSVSSSDHVTQSLAVLRGKHAAGVFGSSRRFSRRFRSSLLVEEGAIAYYQGRLATVVSCLARAIAICPMRDREFFAMIARRLAGLASSRYQVARAKLRARRTTAIDTTW